MSLCVKSTKNENYLRTKPFKKNIEPFLTKLLTRNRIKNISRNSSIKKVAKNGVRTVLQKNPYLRRWIKDMTNIPRLKYEDNDHSDS